MKKYICIVLLSLLFSSKLLAVSLGNPHIESIKFDSGVVSMHIQSGKPFELLVSENLIDWISIGKFDGGEWIYFIDPIRPYHFYRAKKTSPSVPEPSGGILIAGLVLGIGILFRKFA